MRAKAEEIKKWAETNLSSLAWKRIVLRTLPTFNEFGFELDQLESPTSDVVLEGKLLYAIFQSLDEFYKAEVPLELLKN